VSAKIFAGRYEIIDRIGHGGMGVVYKATDTLLNKVVALKVLTQKKVSDQAVLRFQAEAKAAGKLNHPNIVMILDFGTSEEGEPYMVQEYVEGTNLADLLRPHGLAIEHALGLFDQICDGLARAHESGIIHRDIKPSNVIVTKMDGGPLAKLTDFGIAKLVEADQALTSTGAMVGSPLYMSPEQTRGEPSTLEAISTPSAV
jgi:Serine/threonine protein kinase